MRLRNDKETTRADKITLTSSGTRKISSIKNVWRKLRGGHKTNAGENEETAPTKSSIPTFGQVEDTDEQQRNSEGVPVYWIHNGYRHTNNPLTIEQWSTFFEQEKDLQHSRQYISGVKKLFDVPPTSLESLEKRVRDQEKSLSVRRRENFGDGVFIRLEEMANPGVSSA
jgi:hypothetical protein